MIQVALVSDAGECTDLSLTVSHNILWCYVVGPTINSTMAKPIKETPILHGKDAKRFEKIIKDNQNKKVSADEYNHAIENYRKLIKSACLD